jgi:hypothetical protein
MLKEALPNFPDEVLEDWLLTYAKSEGWPPPLDSAGFPMARWRYLLGLRSLAELQALSWTLEERVLGLEELAAGQANKIVSLLKAAVKKERNEYSAIGDSEARIARIVQHVKASGRLPKAPTLIDSGKGLEIMDGNHRVATYFFLLSGAENGVPNTIPIIPAQTFWIGRTPDTSTG